jgi:hypothetical protein
MARPRSDPHTQSAENGSRTTGNWGCRNEHPDRMPGRRRPRLRSRARNACPARYPSRSGSSQESSCACALLSASRASHSRSNLGVSVRVTGSSSRSVMFKLILRAKKIRGVCPRLNEDRRHPRIANYLLPSATAARAASAIASSAFSERLRPAVRCSTRSRSLLPGCQST